MLTVLFTLVLGVPAASASTILGALSRGDLKNAGRGCEFFEAAHPETMLFFADAGSSSVARVDDRRVALRLRFSNYMRAKKIGDRFADRYETGNLKISYEGSITQGRDSRGRLTVQQGKRKEVVEIVAHCEKL